MLKNTDLNSSLEASSWPTLLAAPKTTDGPKRRSHVGLHFATLLGHFIELSLLLLQLK